MAKIEGFPVLTVTYGKSGKAEASDHAQQVKDFVKNEDLDELLVISHGWNNSASEAMSLYTGLLKRIRENLSSEPRIKARKIGLLAVIWPSKKFKAFEREDMAGHAGGAASAEPQIGDPMEDARVLVTELEDDLTADQRKTLMDAAEAAVKDAANWPNLIETLRSTVPQGPDDGDDGDAALFDGVSDPASALAQFDLI